MFITRECDYAVRIVRELSDYNRKPVKEICDKECIPFQFAYKILKKLEKNCIVKSYRGTKGGYQLNKSLEEITLYDVFMAVEEEIILNECLTQHFECPMNTSHQPCAFHRELFTIQKTLMEGLKKKSIAEILNP